MHPGQRTGAASSGTFPNPEKEGLFPCRIIRMDDVSRKRHEMSVYVQEFTGISLGGMPEKPPVFEKWRLFG
jgi:hypothetical protein